MKKTIAFLMTVFVAHHCFSQPTMEQQADELLQSYYQLGKFNGSVLIAAHGKIILSKGYGYSDIKKGLKTDENTIFQIASVTKQFTAVMILKLVELKKLTLTDPISQYFEGLPKADSITIENLLTHTSGITDHYSDSSLTPSTPLTEDKLLAAIRKYPLSFSPGMGWEYSNKGYQLLGYIIQQVTGMTYYGAIRKYIFVPLRMDNSGFDFVHLARPGKATGYWTFPRDAKAEPAQLIDSSAPFAAGAIYSTVKDLYKWNEGLQHYKIVGKELMDKAYNPFRNHYGYGWTIDSIFNQRVVHHSGDIFGFKADIERITENDDCIILLGNDEDVNSGMISRKLLAVLCSQPYQLPAKNKIQLMASELAKYSGTYEIQPGADAEVIVEDGKLMAVTDHKQELYAQSRNVFIADDGNTQIAITFEKDDLFFYKDGQKITCKKIK